MSFALVLDEGSHHSGGASVGGHTVAVATETALGAVGDSAEVGGAFLGVTACLNALRLSAALAFAFGFFAVLLAVNAAVSLFSGAGLSFALFTFAIANSLSAVLLDAALLDAVERHAILLGAFFARSSVARDGCAE